MLCKVSCCLHLLVPISPLWVLLPLCTCHTKSVLYFDFLLQSGAGAWFLNILPYGAIYHFNLQACVCAWQWARFTFVTCWSKCSECPLLLLWPHQLYSWMSTVFWECTELLCYGLFALFKWDHDTCTSPLLSVPEHAWTCLGTFFFNCKFFKWN